MDVDVRWGSRERKERWFDGLRQSSSGGVNYCCKIKLSWFVISFPRESRRLSVVEEVTFPARVRGWVSSIDAKKSRQRRNATMRLIRFKFEWLADSGEYSFGILRGTFFCGLGGAHEGEKISGEIGIGASIFSLA